MPAHPCCAGRHKAAKVHRREHGEQPAALWTSTSSAAVAVAARIVSRAGFPVVNLAHHL